MPSPLQGHSEDLAALRAENAELRSRVELAEREIAQLRSEALARRAEVRSLAEAFPAAMSRHALVIGMLRDVRHHPDKKGALSRAIRKLGRAPRKAVRLVRGRVK
jgi:septal ring factor EnvC (AmiA/AmiB activator)